MEWMSPWSGGAVESLYISDSLSLASGTVRVSALVHPRIETA